jgi:hypothetical protein
MTGVAFSVAGEEAVDAGVGIGVSLVLLILLGMVWGCIAERRPWRP